MHGPTGGRAAQGLVLTSCVGSAGRTAVSTHCAWGVMRRGLTCTRAWAGGNAYGGGRGGAGGGAAYGGGGGGGYGGGGGGGAAWGGGRPKNEGGGWGGDGI